MAEKRAQAQGRSKVDEVDKPARSGAYKTKPKKSGYFKTDINLITRIAETTQDFNTVAAYLALARHGNGKEADPYRHTGAGKNKIKEYGHMGDASAHIAEASLREHGFIKLLENPTKQARYLLTHQELNIALPWLLVQDGGKPGSLVTSALRRIQALRTEKLKLDALMVMLNCYRRDHLKMEDKGGIDGVFRKWTAAIIPKTDKMNEWKAKAAPTDSAYTSFMLDCLRYRLPAKPKRKTVTQDEANDFWAAWSELKKAGLVYEAVTLRNSQDNLVVTLRVNDLHANQANKDPAYMRLLGKENAFYASVVHTPGNYNEDYDTLRVMMPTVFDKDDTIVSVYRPRFRMATEDVGKWLEHEKYSADNMLSLIAQDLQKPEWLKGAI